MSIRIYAPVEFDGEWLTFAASGDDGDCLVRIGRLAWEQIQAAAPVGMDGQDRRDYALGIVEARATAAMPAHLSNPLITLS